MKTKQYQIAILGLLSLSVVFATLDTAKAGAAKTKTSALKQEIEASLPPPGTPPPPGGGGFGVPAKGITSGVSVSNP